MYASSFENVEHKTKAKDKTVLIYENELYEVDDKLQHCYNIDLTTDYMLNKLKKHEDYLFNTLIQSQFAVYYDRTYSYRRYVSPLLYMSAITDTIVLFDEQSDYEQCLVNSIYKNNNDLINFIIVNEENCKEKKKVILSDENLIKSLIKVQKDWYNMAKKFKLSSYIQI